MGIYNVTNRGETTWCGFAREIVRLAGLAVPVEPITTADFAAPVPGLPIACWTRPPIIASAVPPMPDWKEALREYFAELRRVE